MENNNHKITEVHKNELDQEYGTCTCGELHLVTWQEGVIPIADTTTKLCKECKKNFCCNMCRLLSAVH
ncbi:MAG: hypothetical protein KBC17_01955 [Candidatus Pacebacteria bacterium]|nr:hypothetical protein [Candidatus Paceibacterota bacterium]